MIDIGTRGRRAAMVVAACLAGSGAGWAQTAAPAGSPPAGAPKVACDAQCIRANSDKAVQACAPRIETDAPGDYEWLFRPYGRIFQEADLPEKSDPSVVRFRGDSIRFLSPQKEWVRAIYECGYDTADQKVAYVRVKLGVLGKKSAVPAQAVPTAAAGQAVRAPVVAAAAGVPAPATVNLRLIGEPSAVDVRQVPVGARPVTP